MRIGTKSILYGYHCFLIHPFFVAAGWWKLYGFPWDPRLWVAFVVHDLGYWGKPNMDGEEGEAHVFLGAKIMGWLFDEHTPAGTCLTKDWYQLSFYHSRYQAKKYNTRPSRLCFADKLAFILYPRWLALLLYTLTGEWREYFEAHKHEVKYDPLAKVTMALWYDESVKYVAEWIEAHLDGKEDTWTKTKPAQ